jgi:phosphate transport system substrate-binding protein
MRGINVAAAAVATAAVFTAGCGSTPEHPPPAAASPKPGSAVIHAVGSDYAAPVYQEVGNRLLASGVTLNYQLTRATVLPAATDRLRHRGIAVVAAESSQPMGSLPHLRSTSELYVPVGFGAVSVIYNLPGLHAPLRLNAGVLAAIYEERIKRWNDRRIVHDNRRAGLPSLPITVIHRSDPAVATDLFTQFLSAGARRWRRGPGSGAAISWPAGTAVSGDAAVRQIISQTPGAIGYTDQATALQDKLHSAALRNPLGEFVEPSLHAVSAVGLQPRAGDDLSLTTINARATGAYPIAAEEYLLTFRDPCAAGLSHPEASGDQRFLTYMLGAGQGVVRRLSFAPLPHSMRASARREVRALRCDGDGV